MLQDQIEWTPVGPTSKHLSMYYSENPRQLSFKTDACVIDEDSRVLLSAVIELATKNRPENIFFALTKLDTSWSKIGKSRNSNDKIHIYECEEYLSDINYLFHRDLPTGLK